MIGHLLRRSILILTVLAFAGSVIAQGYPPQRRFVRYYPSRIRISRPYYPVRYAPSPRCTSYSRVVVVREVRIYERQPSRRDYSVQSSYRSVYQQLQASAYPTKYERYDEPSRFSSESGNYNTIEDSLTEIQRRLSKLEAEMDRNEREVEEIKEFKEEILKVKTLLLEFKRRNLR